MKKSILQKTIENSVQSLLSIIKVLILSKFRVSLPKREFDDCVILGNGPSLITSIENNIQFLQNKELFCVNHFGETPLYLDLKPRNYVLNAPEMWMDDVEKLHRDKGEILFDAIARNTSWPINLFIPKGAKKYKGWKNKLGQNSNIKIIYFNTTPINGFDTFVFFMMRRNLGLPRPHNVLIPTIAMACNLKFNNIYLIGADHSWLGNIWVDDNNEVLLTQKHFYDIDSAKGRPMDNLGKGKRKLHEVLQKFVFAFQGYFVLEKYSRQLNSRIINMTPGSYIDAFEKIK